jgi:hypothetical protein
MMSSMEGEGASKRGLQELGEFATFVGATLVGGERLSSDDQVRRRTGKKERVR